MALPHNIYTPQIRWVVNFDFYNNVIIIIYLGCNAFHE